MSKAENQEIILHPEPYPFEDFCAYIDAVIRPLCEEKHQKFVLNTSPIRGCTPLVDITRLNRIYFNLLSNAVKYTPEGGTISLTIQEKQLPENRILFTITVCDNGIGMSPEFQSHLFEPFMQENRNDISATRGTGLGLAIVKKMVDAMNGTIHVESEKGKGSSFIVSIASPFISQADLQKEKAQTSNEESLDHRRLAGCHILLCEDHPLNQEIAKAILTEQGMTVDIAENGQSGTERFGMSSVDFFDCILMDIRMPVMDGYEATRAIRKLERPDAKTVPIIAMTADAFTEDIQKCFDAGMNGHIAKPINPEALCCALSEALKKKNPA